MFRFRKFAVRNDLAALKVGTDAVLLGSLMSLPQNGAASSQDPVPDISLLDVGTGTGVIALMAAQRLDGRRFRIDAIDIDPPSVQEAALNFADSPWKDSLKAELCPLQTFRGGKYDSVFSNPPFYDNSLTNPSGRQSSARHTTDLSFRDICAFASDSLKESGILSLILPSEQEKVLVRTAASFGLYLRRAVRIRTTPRKPLRRIVADFCRIRPEEGPVLQEICIHNADGSLSEEYLRLSSEFLLAGEE